MAVLQVDRIVVVGVVHVLPGEIVGGPDAPLAGHLVADIKTGHIRLFDENEHPSDFANEPSALSAVDRVAVFLSGIAAPSHWQFGSFGVHAQGLCFVISITSLSRIIVFYTIPLTFVKSGCILCSEIADETSAVPSNTARDNLRDGGCMFGKKKLQVTGSAAAAIEAVRRTVELFLEARLDWAWYEAELQRFTFAEADMSHGASVWRRALVTGVLRTSDDTRYIILEARTSVSQYHSRITGWEPSGDICVLLAKPDLTRVSIHSYWDRPIPRDGFYCANYDKLRAVPETVTAESHPHVCALKG